MLATPSLADVIAKRLSEESGGSSPTFEKQPLPDDPDASDFVYVVIGCDSMCLLIV